MSATVNVLTWATIDRHRDVSRKMPTTKRTWPKPGQDVGEAEHEILPADPAGRCGSGAANETGSLAAPPTTHCVCTAVADPDVQGIGPQREAVVKAKADEPPGTGAAEPHLRRRLRKVVEGGRRDILEGGRGRPAVERDLDTFKEHMRERRNPAIALVARQVA